MTKRRLQVSTTFEILDREYEVSTRFLWPASPLSTGILGDDAEVELNPFVIVSGAASGEEVCLLDSFLMDFAVSRKYTLEQAENWIHDQLAEKAQEKYVEDYDGPPDGEAWSGGFAENH